MGACFLCVYVLRASSGWFVRLLLRFFPFLFHLCLCLSVSVFLSLCVSLPPPLSLSLPPPPSLYRHEEGAGVVVGGWVGERGASGGVVGNMKTFSISELPGVSVRRL